MNLHIPTPDFYETRFSVPLRCVDKTHDEITDDYHIVLSAYEEDEAFSPGVQTNPLRTLIVLSDVPVDMAKPFFDGSTHYLDATIRTES